MSAILQSGSLTLNGVAVPIALTDNQDGTYSPNIAAALTLDPTNLALDSTVSTINSYLSVLGTPSDVAWSNTGEGTLIAILKKIALNTTPV